MGKDIQLLLLLLIKIFYIFLLAGAVKTPLETGGGWTYGSLS